MTWTAAEQFCVTDYGGHLASFHSEEEYIAVMNGLEEQHGTRPHGWIGLTDVSKEGVFVWSDGSSSIWTDNWVPGKPAGENGCVENSFQFPKWRDIKCAETAVHAISGARYSLGAICKRSAGELSPIKNKSTSIWLVVLLPEQGLVEARHTTSA